LKEERVGHVYDRNILIVSPVAPSNETEGRSMRLAVWLRKLSGEANIYLIIISQDPQLVSIDIDEWNIKECHIIQVQDNYRHMKSIWSRLPFMADKYPQNVAWVMPVDTKKLEKVVESLQGVNFERLVTFRLYTHLWAKALIERLSIEHYEIDLDDYDSKTFLSIATLALRLKKIKDTLFYLKISWQYKVLETKWIKFYHKAYAANFSDLDEFKKTFSNIQWEVLPNKISKGLIPPSLDRKELKIVFVGTLGYLPNEEAIRWFIKNVFVKLQSVSEREWHLTVAGRGAKEGLKEFLKRIPNVDFKGEVEEVLPIYSGTTAAVVPLHGGGGTKLKTLEAFKAGIPVVATSEGVSGLKVIDCIHYIKAESPKQWVEALLELAADPEKALYLAKNAQKYLINENLIN
jgi:glycosyltransferase involved in cell wall biosynthesis